MPTVAASVDLIVHIGTDPSGQRRVREIVALSGRTERDVVETSDIFHSRDGVLARADGFPPHAERFARIGIELVSVLGPSADEPSSARHGTTGRTW